MLMVIAFFYGIIYALIFFGWILGLPVPHAFIDMFHHMAGPFLPWIRQNFPVSYFHFGDNKQQFENSYSILLFIDIVLFIFFVNASTFFYRLDYHVKSITRSWSHKYFMWKQKRMQHKTVLKTLHDLYKSEKSVIVAMSMEHIEEYPTLEVEIQRRMNDLKESQIIDNQPEYTVLKFNSTLQAIEFVQSFCKEFKQIRSIIRVKLEKKPVYHIAIHSLEKEGGLFEDESFIKALLNCTAANQVFISLNTKKQLDFQNKALRMIPEYEIVPMGTFSKLGNRTFPEVFRLLLKTEDKEQVG